jgi:4-amino-4-deoxy-L-arabinose transferase-like glycosyltransferase
MKFVLQPRIALALLWLIATLANVTKAVHIDDPTYLLIARHILEDPLYPMSGALVLSGEMTPIYVTNQPPLLFYGFAGVMALFGESEIALHLFISVFSGLAIVCFYGLGRRYCPQHALLLTAAFCLGPAFLPSQNLMTDVPTVSLWLLFFWILVTGLNSSAPTRAYVAAGVVLGAACLTKYTSLALLPLLCVPIAVRRDWKRAWVLLVPVAILVGWSLFNIRDYGQAHILTRQPMELSFQRVAGRLDFWLICLGAISPCSILVVPWAKRRKGLACVAVVVVAVAAIVHPERPLDAGPYAPILAHIFFANGLLLALVTIACLGRNQDECLEHRLLLAGWFAAGAGFVILLAPFLAVRHVLLVVPAVLLAVGRCIEGRRARAWMAAACALTVALGAILALSDWIYADAYRSRARMARQQFGPEARLWYVGDWGWRWYAEAEGMKPLLMSSRLRKGDLVIIPEAPPGPKSVTPRYEHKVEQSSVVDVPASAAVFVRTMRPFPAGGYYGVWLRGLPWLVSTEPLERFHVFRVFED